MALHCFLYKSKTGECHHENRTLSASLPGKCSEHSSCRPVHHWRHVRLPSRKKSYPANKKAGHFTGVVGNCMTPTCSGLREDNRQLRYDFGYFPLSHGCDFNSVIRWIIATRGQAQHTAFSLRWNWIAHGIGALRRDRHRCFYVHRVLLSA